MEDSLPVSGEACACMLGAVPACCQSMQEQSPGWHSTPAMQPGTTRPSLQIVMAARLCCSAPTSFEAHTKHMHGVIVAHGLPLQTTIRADMHVQE